MQKSILIINGPNLNTLGKRQPEIYGTLTLEQINEMCKNKANSLNLALETFQSNHEGEIVENIHQAAKKYNAIIINPAAFTHTSVAILDALLFTDLPIIEIHLSNIYTRESFRHKSYISPIAKGIISGFGAYGYLLAIDAASQILK